MLTYDVLAALWEAPATDVQVARAVEDRIGLPCSRNHIDQYLRLLRTTGYVKTRDAQGALAYSLTDSGAALLSKLAGALEREESV